MRRDACGMRAPGVGRRSDPEPQGQVGGQDPHDRRPGVAPHWPSNRGTFDKPGLFEKDLVIEVTNQEGRRFWGKQTFSGGGEQTSEPMIGELTGKDNKTVVLVDTDGFLDGQLVNNNTMTFCYKQAGGRTESSVVSCSELKRTP